MTLEKNGYSIILVLIYINIYIMEVSTETLNIKTNKQEKFELNRAASDLVTPPMYTYWSNNSLSLFVLLF